MMAEMARLLPNRSSTMTVGASDLAPGDLPLERRDRVLEQREACHAATLGPDVVELQDDKVALTAVEAPGTPEMLEDYEEVAASARVVVELSRPVGIDAPGVGAQSRAAAVAVCADQLTPCDLRLDASQPVSLVHEYRYRGSLRPDVIELEHERGGETTVSALARRNDVEYVAPGVGAATIASRAGLTPVEVAALAHVSSPARLAPVGPLMEIGHLPAQATPVAEPRLDGLGGSRAGRTELRRRRDAAGPDARRGNRDSKVTCDPAQRPALCSELAGVCLFGDLASGHTNICSQADRTA
jgi:hypothetical protein